MKRRNNAKRGHSSHRNKNNQNKKMEIRQNDVFIFGKHVVQGVLEEDKQVKSIYLQKDLSKDIHMCIMKFARQKKLEISEVSKRDLDDITKGANHQGVVAVMPAYEYQPLEEAIRASKSREEASFFVILDEIEDPHNLGSILRSAEASGVHGIIVPKHRNVGLTGTVAKVSAGSIDRVPVIQVTNISQTIERLQKEGVWIFASDMAGEDMRQWDTSGSIAIVIGNEGRGVSPLVKERCDGTVTIPMAGEIESLNAGVAAALLMYEVARERL